MLAFDDAQYPAVHVRVNSLPSLTMRATSTQPTPKGFLMHPRACPPRTNDCHSISIPSVAARFVIQISCSIRRSGIFLPVLSRCAGDAVDFEAGNGCLQPDGRTDGEQLVASADGREPSRQGASASASRLREPTPDVAE
jgi:hypothetical protein